MSRVFTDEELAELGKKPGDKVREAIESGDEQKALDAFAAFEANFDSTHDNLSGWICDMMSYIYEKLGNDGLYDAMLRHTRASFPAMKDWLDPLPFKERVEAICGALAMHNVPMDVTEDDDKVTFKMQPCASGIRALIDQGFYEPPRNCALCAADERTTWGVDRFPCYCVHAPLQDRVAQECGMKGWYYQKPPEEFGTEACEFQCYKDYDKFPDDYWTRVGRHRPEPGKTITDEDLANAD